MGAWRFGGECAVPLTKPLIHREEDSPAGVHANTKSWAKLSVVFLIAAAVSVAVCWCVISVKSPLPRVSLSARAAPSDSMEAESTDAFDNVKFGFGLLGCSLLVLSYGLWHASWSFEDLCKYQVLQQIPRPGQIVRVRSTGVLGRVISCHDQYLLVDAHYRWIFLQEWVAADSDSQDVETTSTKDAETTSTKKSFLMGIPMYAKDLELVNEEGVHRFFFEQGGIVPGSGHRVAAVVSLVVGIACILPACSLLVKYMVPSSTSFSVPADEEMLEDLAACRCIAYFGRAVLAPLTLNVLAVLVMFGGNLVRPFYQAYLNEDLSHFGRRLYQATKSPWLPLLVVSLVSSLVHYLSAIYVVLESDMNWWEAYETVYVKLVTSGAQTFVVTALFGAFLANVFQPSINQLLSGGYCSALGFRLLGFFIIWMIEIPVLFTHAIPGILLWPWISIPAEVLVAVILVVIFPARAAEVDSFTRAIVWGDTLGRKLSGLVAFQYFPLVLPIQKLCHRMGVGIGKRSPTGYVFRTLIMTLFIFMKVVIQQALFMFAINFYHGVAYSETVPLFFKARHWLCNACLLSKKEQVAAETLRWLTGL